MYLTQSLVFAVANPEHRHRHDLSGDEINSMVDTALEAVNLGGPEMLRRQVSTLSGRALTPCAFSSSHFNPFVPDAT